MKSIKKFCLNFLTISILFTACSSNVIESDFNKSANNEITISRASNTNKYAKSVTLKDDWFESQSIVNKNNVESILFSSSIPNSTTYSISWDAGDTIKAYYNPKTKDLIVASQNEIFAPFLSINLFSNFGAVKSIRFENFNTSKAYHMGGMFNNCKSLKTLDLKCFDTSTTSSFFSMFDGCTALESLDLSNFNTARVTDMSQMFYACTSLTYLDLSGFNTSNLGISYRGKKLNNMFEACFNLTKLITTNKDILMEYHNR